MTTSVFSGPIGVASGGGQEVVAGRRAPRNTGRRGEIPLPESCQKASLPSTNRRRRSASFRVSPGYSPYLRVACPSFSRRLAMISSASAAGTRA